MGHTPIPWKLDSKPTNYPQAVESSDGTVLAITGNDRANAAFIVRAANNHAELLDALEAFRFFPCQGDGCTNYPAGLCPGCHVRAVIEKANK